MSLNSKENQTEAFTYIANLWPSLAMDEFNYKLLCGWINVNAGSDFTPNNLTHAVEALWKKLNKEQPAAPAESAEPAAEPAQVLGKLSDGTQQLPLDASDFKIRNASTEQVRDLTRRQYAASAQSKTLFITPPHQRNQGGF